MRTYLLFFSAIALIAGNSCQPKIDVEKEKEAIMKVIQTESETARDANFEGLAACYIQDELNTRLDYSLKNYAVTTGWENVKKILESVTANTGQDYSGIKITKDNAIIKVMGNTAWLICNNNWKGTFGGAEVEVENIQVTFLEKVDGSWKISFAAWISKPEPEMAAGTPEKAE